jgi:hypothetical protein
VVELIRQRASAQAAPGLLLTVNAVKTLALNSGPSQLPATSITTPSQIAKNMITNASFRAKKMGDDIPKVASDNVAVSTTDAAANTEIANNIKALANMSSISEEILEEMAEKTPTHAIEKAAAGGGKEVKESAGNMAKNLVEASAKSIVASSKISKDKLAMAKAKLNIRKRIESEKGDGGGGIEMSLKKSDKKSSSASAVAVDGAMASSSDGGGGKKTSTSADKKKHLLPLAPVGQLQMPGSPSPRDLQTQRSNNGDAVYSGSNVSASTIDSIEQVEALIQRNKLPAETVAIHSPESGTTIF